MFCPRPNSNDAHLPAAVTLAQASNCNLSGPLWLAVADLPTSYAARLAILDKSAKLDYSRTMTHDLVIARVLFVDGMWRPVHEQFDGRQYVFDDGGERIYGIWFIPREACPSNSNQEVTMNRNPAGHCFVDPALEEFGPTSCPPASPAINTERMGEALAELDGMEDMQHFFECHIRELLGEMLTNPLKATVAELSIIAGDPRLSPDDRLILGTAIARLVTATPIGSEVENVADGLGELVRASVRQTLAALRELNSWAQARDAAAASDEIQPVIVKAVE
jgi:hypothetical protein